MKHGDPIRWNGHDGIIYDDPELDITCCNHKPCGKVTVKVFPSGGGFTVAHVRPDKITRRESNAREGNGPTRKTAHVY